MAGYTFTEGTVVAHRFRVERLLGTGGYGEVYAAEQLSMGRSVALKVLRQRLTGQEVALDRFKNEARFACQLRHPNTVVYYDFGEDEERRIYWLAMEYLEGRSLTEQIRREGVLGFEACADIIDGIAGSLDEAHEFGLIHRDIKPGNVMLVSRAGNSNYVKVIDFGIAKAVSVKSPGIIRSLTASGTLLGSPAYMAPEQIRRTHAPLGPYTDIYALGVMTYRLLSGVLPIRGATPIEVAMAHLTTPPPRLGSLGVTSAPRALEDLLQEALSKNPEDRPQSALEFAERFRAAISADPANFLKTPTTLLDMTEFARQDASLEPVEELNTTEPARVPEATLRRDQVARSQGRATDVGQREAPQGTPVPPQEVAPEPFSSTATLSQSDLPPPDTKGQRTRWSARHKTQLVLAVSVILLGSAVIIGLVTIGIQKAYQPDGADTGEILASPAAPDLGDSVPPAVPSAELGLSNPTIDAGRPLDASAAQSEVQSGAGASPDAGRTGGAAPRRIQKNPRPSAGPRYPPSGKPSAPPPVHKVKVAFTADPWGSIQIQGKSARRRLVTLLPPGKYRVVTHQDGKHRRVHMITVRASGRRTFVLPSGP
jgi:serine/threonine-protein kinase